MSSKFLDYVILALIFFIAVAIFFNITNKSCGNEQMSQLISSEEVLKIASETLPIQMTDITLSEMEETPLVKMNDIMSIQSNDVMPSKMEEMPLVKINDVMSSKMEETVSIQIKDTDQRPVQLIATSSMPAITEQREKILAYQNKMFEFNEIINKPSSGVDTVDKLNELFTTGNTEMAGFKGKTISEVYNGLTQGVLDKKKKCVNTGCLIPPIKDNITNIESYLIDTDKGKYFRHGLMYEDDDVETGSKFYDSIEASDSEYENYLVV